MPPPSRVHSLTLPLAWGSSPCERLSAPTSFRVLFSPSLFFFFFFSSFFFCAAFTASVACIAVTKNVIPVLANDTRFTVKTNELRALHQIPPSPGWGEGEGGEIDNFRFEGIEFFLLLFFFFFFQPPPRLDSFLPGLQLVRWIIIIIIIFFFFLRNSNPSG